MTIPLFDAYTEPAVPERLDEGALLLRGFATAQAGQWIAEVQALQAVSPFRIMQVPGGKSMSVATTSCGAWGWISDAGGYRYSAVDPQTGRPWPAMPAFLALQALRRRRPAMRALFPTPAWSTVTGPAQRWVCIVTRMRPTSLRPLCRCRWAWAALSLGWPQAPGPGPAHCAGPWRCAGLGGPTRLAYHGVGPLKDGSHHLLGNERWNLTFRMAKAGYPGR